MTEGELSHFTHVLIVSKWFQDKEQIVWHCKIWFGGTERIFQQATAGTLGCRVLPQFTIGGAF